MKIFFEFFSLLLEPIGLTTGFTLLGYNTILRAQKGQIKIEALGNEIQRVKNNEKVTAKLVKA